MTQRAVFLDRDGVLNRAVVRDGKPYPPPSVGEMEIVEGAAASLARLKELGFLLLVVTNQPDVARGTQTIETIEAMHDSMRRTLPLDDFLVCPHDDRDLCDCRKPRPGLLFQGQAKYGIDLGRSFMVGDRWRDIDAGRAAGCRTANGLGRLLYQGVAALELWTGAKPPIDIMRAALKREVYGHLES